MISVLLSVLALGLLQGEAAPLSPATEVELEWAVRAAALDPKGSPALQAWLESPDWTLRYAALDALARSPQGARWAAERGTVLAASEGSQQSNLRAAALRLRWAQDAVAPMERRLSRPPALAGAEELHAWSAWLALGVGAGGAATDGPDGDVALAAAELEAWLRSKPAGLDGVSGPAPLLSPALALVSAGPGAGAAQLDWIAPGGQLLVERLDGLLGPWMRHPSDAALSQGLGAALSARSEPRDREESVLVGLVRGLTLVLGEEAGSPVDLDLAMPPGDHLGSDLASTRSRARRELFLGEVAERVSPEIAVAWVQAAGERKGAAREGLLQAAALALEPAQALPLALELDSEAASILWRCTEGAQEPLERSLCIPWLAPDKDSELRFAAAQELARGLAAADGRERALLLLPLVHGEDSSLRLFAFRRLAEFARPAGAQPAGALTWAELHAAWSRLPAGLAVERLADLPRRGGPALPFRAVLLELLGATATRSPARIELLGPMAHEPDVRAALVRAFEQEFERVLDGARSPSERRSATRQAHACLLAMGPRGRGPEDFARDLERLLAGWQAAPAQERGSSLTELLVAHLAKTPEGRRLLLAGMTSAWPRRERVEAFLQLSSQGDGADLAPFVNGVLAEDYPRCDSDLRLRLVRALAAPALRPRAFLLGLAMDPTGEELFAREACSVLAKRAAVPALKQVLGEARGLEARRSAASALGLVSAEGESGQAATAALLEALPQLPEAPTESKAMGGAAELPQALDPEGPERALELAILLALEQRGALGDGLLARLWRGPLATSASDLGLRFRGLGRASMEFRWRDELVLVGRLAAAGRLPAALERCPQPWRLDGRFLEAAAASADRARAKGPGSLRLARLALVALAGEAPSRLGALAQVRARSLAFEGALAGEDWAAAAFHGDRLALRLRIGGAPARELLRQSDFAALHEAHRYVQVLRLVARAERERAAGRSASAARLDALAQAAKVGP